MKATQAKKVIVNNGIETLRLDPIEKELALQAIVRMNLRGRSVSAYMLQQGAEGAESLRFVWGFDCRGVHSTLKPHEVDPTFDSIENGLKDLPQGEKLTIHFGSFSSDLERQAQLSQIYLNTDSDPLKFLVMGEKTRVAELTRSGLRKPKFLRLYVTYTIEPSATKGNDFIETAIAKLMHFWNKFTGNAATVQETRYENAFEKAFTDGFITWEQLLTVKMNLNVRLLTEQELWSNLWKQFNTSECPPLPQIIDFSEEGIKDSSNSQAHLTTLLFDTQASVPVADRAFVHLKDKYIGIMPFIDKPGGWANKQSQLGYLWEIFSRDAVTDTEVFSEYSRANDGIVKENMSRVTRQSIASQESSAQNKGVDVGASIKQRKAIAAQEELYEGALPINVAVVFLVHRNTPNELDTACRYLRNCFPKPAWVDRETEYAWRIWLQTLPITWDAMLVTPFARRLIYLTGEAPGFMSLVRPRPVGKEGLELVSDEGGVPLFLDLYTEHRNLALFATTRAGKSVLVSGILMQGLCRGIPTIIMDFPPNDAASTFKDFTSYVGGSYFDIGKESNNLFELPDLSRFTPKERAERLSDYRDFIESAVMTMVFGAGEPSNSTDRIFKQAIRSVIGPAISNFFEDPEILKRYELARIGELGSSDWDNTPTLVDFLSYFEVKGLQGLSEETLRDPSTATAVTQVKRQLRFWISSRVGKAIARPSTFRTDALLLVFALRGLSDAEDAAIMALSAYSAALRRALSSPRSIFFIDEFSVLLEWDEIGGLIGRLTANGAKAGIVVILAAQDPNTLANSSAGPRIIQNISTRLIGRIQPVAVQSFVDILKYELPIISRNSTESFFPKKEGMYSQWLLDDNSVYTFVRYYSPPVLLAVVANNPHETLARQAFMQAHDDRYQALAAFATELASSLREGRKFRLPSPLKSAQPIEPVESDPRQELVAHSVNGKVC